MRVEVDANATRFGGGRVVRGASGCSHWRWRARPQFGGHKGALGANANPHARSRGGASGICGGAIGWRSSVDLVDFEGAGAGPVIFKVRGPVVVRVSAPEDDSLFEVVDACIRELCGDLNIAEGVPLRGTNQTVCCGRVGGERELA